MSGETKEDPRLKALRTGRTTKFASHDALPNNGFGRYGPVSLEHSYPGLASKLPPQMLREVRSLRTSANPDVTSTPMIQLTRDRSNLMHHIKAVGSKKEEYKPQIMSVGRQHAAMARAGVGDHRVSRHLPNYIRQHVDNLHAPQISDLTKTGLGDSSKRKKNIKTQKRSKSPQSRGGGRKKNSRKKRKSYKKKKSYKTKKSHKKSRSSRRRKM